MRTAGCRAHTRNLWGGGSGIMTTNAQYSRLSSKDTIKLFSYIFLYHMWTSLAGGNSQNFSRKILILQKQSLQAFNKAGLNDHTNQFFVDLKILKLPELHTWHTTKFMFKCINNALSRPLSNVFLPPKEVPIGTVQKRHDLSTAFHRSTTTQNSLFHLGPKIWNNLDIKIKNMTTLFSFKEILKSMLIQTYI